MHQCNSCICCYLEGWVRPASRMETYTVAGTGTPECKHTDRGPFLQVASRLGFWARCGPTHTHKPSKLGTSAPVIQGKPCVLKSKRGSSTLTRPKRANQQDLMRTAIFDPATFLVDVSLLTICQLWFGTCWGVLKPPVVWPWQAITTWLVLQSGALSASRASKAGLPVVPVCHSRCCQSDANHDIGGIWWPYWPYCSTAALKIHSKPMWAEPCASEEQWHVGARWLGAATTMMFGLSGYYCSAFRATQISDLGSK